MGRLEGPGMSGIPALDWAILAASLFNLMLLTWLGLTVWFTSERRVWGVYLTAIGLLLGAAFFLCHTILLAQSFVPANPWLDFWWHAGWIPLALSPFAWYLVVLWYAGYWEGETALFRRQRPFLFLMGAYTCGILALLMIPGSLPTFIQAASLDLQSRVSVFGVPLLVILIPLYILGCLGLALDALLRPGPTRRPLGDQARTRARPWLLISSLVLLLVSILVTGAIVEIVRSAQGREEFLSYSQLIITITIIDLLITSLISVSVLSLGQALVSYEIFTGKSLPRQGLRRYFRNAVILSGGMSVLVAGAYVLGFSPIYGLLAALLVTVGFYALLTWRSFMERERTIRQLRPFMASQRLYEQAAAASSGNQPALENSESFRALVEEVLDARQAALVPLGPLAVLAGEALVYPQELSADLSFMNQLREEIFSPEKIVLALEPGKYAGFAWVVPLWSERGLIGVLLLGEKNGRGFYTQEEMETARTSGERLVDARASAELVRRLADLQRERMVSSQVLDRRTRRVLHDEILPTLHTSLLKLSSLPSAQTPEMGEVVQLLSDTHRQISALLRDLPVSAPPEIARQGLVGALQHMVKEEFAERFDQVEWKEDETARTAASEFPPLTTEVIYFAAREAVRNAARHARGDSPLHLKFSVSGRPGFRVIIEDDGVGMGPTQAHAIEGSGQGLALHTTLMAVVGGTLGIETQPGSFTRVTLQL
jgi:signal transduction histidine kinase